MAEQFTDPASRLARLVSSVQPRFQAQFLEVVRLLQSERVLSQIEDLINAGQIGEALASAEQAVMRLGSVWAESYILAGNEAAKFVGNALEAIVSFDGTNTRAVEAIQRSQLRLIREFTQEQVAATRAVLTEGIRAGANPREQARALRGSIGLTERQSRAVMNYRRLLTENRPEALDRALRDRRFDSSVLRAIENETPLTTKQIDTMVGRYRERMLRYRSEVIARTEALRSVHEGTDELYRQAIDSGKLDPTELVRTWDSSRDDRVRPSHRAMHGQQRGMGEPFVAPSGAALLRPGDVNGPPEETIQCRCVLTTRFTPAVRASLSTLRP